ncbi:hypothetical protein DIJ64_07755 [Mycobacterium leprae]|uniref:Uncharacterized protein n=1 Tax=Mycobacterium leprae TaxID=1769 RepID=A0AAD0KSC8_MYCLR|nr:hypothetical protein DIJ64_07755 [Mycobacterium leprae]
MLSCTTITAEYVPIAHRISFTDMGVLYRDHWDDHYRRTAFDIGEWGLARQQG